MSQPRAKLFFACDPSKVDVVVGSLLRQSYAEVCGKIGAKAPQVAGLACSAVSVEGVFGKYALLTAEYGTAG